MSERQRFDSSQRVRSALMEEAPDAEWTYAADASDFFLEDWDNISTTTIGGEVDNTSEGTTEEMLERLELLEAGRDAQYEVGVEGDLTYVRAHLGIVPDESLHEYEEADVQARILPSYKGVIFEARTRDAYPEKLLEE